MINPKYVDLVEIALRCIGAVIGISIFAVLMLLQIGIIAMLYAFWIGPKS